MHGSKNWKDDCEKQKTQQETQHQGKLTIQNYTKSRGNSRNQNGRQGESDPKIEAGSEIESYTRPAQPHQCLQNRSVGYGREVGLGV